jgi:hypothetical protein
MSLKEEMNMGDKMILFGNLLGSIAVALVSIGSVLRIRDLPDKPLFSAPSDGLSSGSKMTNQYTNYWER